MTRIILAAVLAAATLVGWFLLSIARLARQLELSGTAGPSPRDASQYDVAPLDIRLVTVTHPGSIPTTGTDWDAWFADNRTHNPDWRN